MMGYLTEQNISERFLEESKKLFDLENGRASLTTALALYLMFSATAFLGKDRAGGIYRTMTFETLRRLKLDQKFPKLNPENPTEERERRVISKALWGIWAAERYSWIPFRGHLFDDYMLHG